VLFGSPDVAIARKGMHHYQISPISGETVIWEWWCDHGKCQMSTVGELATEHGSCSNKSRI
jgi:hypothetical protein